MELTPLKVYRSLLVIVYNIRLALFELSTRLSSNTIVSVSAFIAATLETQDARKSCVGQ
jgi:hypothetical protein